MKKIILSLILVICLAFIVACDNTSLDGEVSLLSFGAKDTPTKNAKHIENGVEYQYQIIEASQDNIELKIEVDNPNDYYMMDYKLISNNESLEILIGDVYEPLANVSSIRWNGVTNKETFLTLRLNSTEDTYLELDYIYFTDKINDKTNYLTNLNNRNEFKIYKVEPIEFNVRTFAGGKYIVDLEVDPRIELIGLTENVVYSETKDIVVNYRYKLDDFSLENQATYTINDDEILKIDYHTILEEDSIHVISHKFDNIEDIKFTLYHTKEDYEKGEIYVVLRGIGDDMVNGKIGHHIYAYDLSYKYIVVEINGFKLEIQVVAK